jgi:hypothetical protein
VIHDTSLKLARCLPVLRLSSDIRTEYSFRYNIGSISCVRGHLCPHGFVHYATKALLSLYGQAISNCHRVCFQERRRYGKSQFGRFQHITKNRQLQIDNNSKLRIGTNFALFVISVSELIMLSDFIGHISLLVK